MPETLTTISLQQFSEAQLIELAGFVEQMTLAAAMGSGPARTPAVSMALCASATGIHREQELRAQGKAGGAGIHVPAFDAEQTRMLWEMLSSVGAELLGEQDGSVSTRLEFIELSMRALPATAD